MLMWGKGMNKNLNTLVRRRGEPSKNKTKGSEREKEKKHARSHGWDLASY